MNRSVPFKVVLLGEGCVGKTSIVLRYTENSFNDKHLETQQASFKVKRLTIDGRRVELAIWDTAGQERFRALGPLYYRDSQGAILVFDITDEDSFDRVKSWVKELKRMLGNDVVLCIVGNKIDLEKDRHVSNQAAEEYARSVNAKLYHTSAKSTKGIDDLFNDLANRMLEKVPATASDSNSTASARAGGIPIQATPTNDPNTRSGSGSCC